MVIASYTADLISPSDIDSAVVIDFDIGATATRSSLLKLSLACTDWTEIVGNGGETRQVPILTK
jgi:hypothetical protein